MGRQGRTGLERVWVGSEQPGWGQGPRCGLCQEAPAGYPSPDHLPRPSFCRGPGKGWDGVDPKATSLRGPERFVETPPTGAPPSCPRPWLKAALRGLPHDRDHDRDSVRRGAPVGTVLGHHKLCGQPAGTRAAPSPSPLHGPTPRSLSRPPPQGPPRPQTGGSESSPSCSWGQCEEGLLSTRLGHRAGGKASSRGTRGAGDPGHPACCPQHATAARAPQSRQ